jgi:hypothetical protein
VTKRAEFATMISAGDRGAARHVRVAHVSANFIVLRHTLIQLKWRLPLQGAPKAAIIADASLTAYKWRILAGTSRRNTQDLRRSRSQNRRREFAASYLQHSRECALDRRSAGRIASCEHRRPMIVRDVSHLGEGIREFGGDTGRMGASLWFATSHKRDQPDASACLLIEVFMHLVEPSAVEHPIVERLSRCRASS